MSAEPLPETGSAGSGSTSPTALSPVGAGAGVAAAGPAGPRIKRPQVLVEPDELVPRLWRAICQECTWTCGPSVKTYIEEMAVWHRKEHRSGAVGAPLRDAEEAQRQAAVGLEHDIRALLAGRGGAHVDDIADGLARMGWRRS